MPVLPRTDFKISNFEIVMLYVKDVKRSTNFYHDLLGLEIVFHHEGRTTFAFGSSRIMIHPGHGDEFPATPPNPIGWGVALYLEVDNVDAAIAHLKNNNVSILQQPADQPWGERDAAVLDPDGYHIHLSQPSPRSWLRNLPLIK